VGILNTEKYGSVTRGMHYCINLISRDVTVSTGITVSTTDNSTTLIMKGRALKPSHPISTIICNILRTQSKADERKKHNKQKRDKKDQEINEMSFQALKQNSYTPSWYCF
jgi:hypothetical protein